MKILTAYNEDVQKFVAPANKKYKESRLAEILERIYDAAVQSVRKLFTPAIRRVVDEIVFLSSGSGICKIGAETLGKRCGFSKELVYKAVSALKKTGEYIVARLADGHAGKYIFVDTAHENFDLIMREVFYLKDNDVESPNKCKDTSHDTEHGTGLENDLEPTATSDTSDFIGPIFYSSSISFSYKQVNNINNNAHAREASNDLKSEEPKDETNSREYLEQYAMNELQLKFYDYIMVWDGVYPAVVTDNAVVLALRLGSDCTKERFTRAKDLIHSLGVQIGTGEVVIENIVATFTGALKKAEERSVSSATQQQDKSIQMSENASKGCSVPFYNWLKDRSHASGRAVYNWITSH